MIKTWGRYVELQVGSLLITSDDLDIEFTINGSSSSDANTAEITAYNLSLATRTLIKPDLDIQLRAGYQGDSGTIYAGRVKKTYEERDQGDLKTKITALTRGFALGLASTNYPKGTSIKSIVEAAFAHSKIPVQNTDGCQEFTLESPYTTDPSADADLQFCQKLINGSEKKHKTARYYIEANGGYFVPENYTRGSETIILSSETGLIETLPEVPGDGAYTRSIRCGLNYRIGTDSRIELQSRVVGASGIYKVVEYSHKCEGTDFETEMKVKPL